MCIRERVRWSAASDVYKRQLPAWNPEKRASGFVVRNFAVSVIALSTSGEEPSCDKRVFISRYGESLWITRLADGWF
ncbi:hypothetical protein JQN47_27025 [Escherichia coli]|nr:hypothetical protein [Escherichia coli]